MRWKAAIIGWMVFFLMGCPHSFGRGGILDRAAAKDTKEYLEDLNGEQPCPSPEELSQLCEERDDPACPRECLQ
ncbi:hypothetical protein DB31_3165 [Hyalangium minutum]|uniref:Lipoprotein n=1 Tax=Hyalangium minutum TaxID=394096 RepID=A0A085WTM2_9BACT|nr:hypothetical protein DB31_3165 [Hyalangium minutum]